MARIYQTTSMGEAHIRVAIVSRGDADLLVYRYSSRGAAYGDARWFITRDRQDATCLIYAVSQGMADVKICFVDSLSEAGWQKESRYKGRFA